MPALSWPLRIAGGVLAAGGLLVAGAVLPLAGQRDAPERRVDAIFAPWTAPGSPGCAVSVMEGGELLFARGYGAANLEHDIPITPATVFHVASVSKQFTALAVALLVAEGAVSWDDDIRRYVPELPDHGAPVTLRQLAHHTSGIRDQWSLLQMAGWRWGGDVITQGDVLDLLSRQRALNFAPGSEYLYSNSGYTLLAVVVERVSGRTLRAFTRERVFGPLGMARTVFRDDHEMIVRNRAHAYEPEGGGRYRISIPDFDIVGATSLFTTVEDLAHWNRNFETGEVGGERVIRQLQQRGALSGGERLSYAFGLVHGTHRGRPTIGHGGTDSGYRGEFLRFADEDLAVAVLCNVRTADPGRLARDVADVFLPAAGAATAGGETAGGETAAREASGREAPDGETASTRRRDSRPARAGERSRTPRDERRTPGEGEEAASGEELDRLAGYYRHAESDVPLHIVVRGDHLLLLAGGAAQPLRPAGGGRFRLAGTSTEAVFEPGRDGGSPTLRLSGGRESVYAHAAPVRPPAEHLAAYAGTYYSDDLAVEYTLRQDDWRLMLRHRKLGDVRLTPTFADGFYGGGWYLTFGRDGDGAVTGFTMSTVRAWKVAFRKTG